METPKEKAQSLFAKFQNIESERYPLGMDDNTAYECAKIVVEEIIPLLFADYKTQGYWEEVLNELNKL